MSDKHIPAAANILCILALAMICFVALTPGQEDEEEFTQEGYEEPVKTTEGSDPVKLFLTAQAEHEKGNLDEALKLYGDAIKANPEFPEAHFQIAVILESRGQYSEAETGFRSAVDYRADWTLALARLGSVLIRNKKFGEADSVLSKAVRLDPMNFPAYIALTELFMIERPSNERLNEVFKSLVYLSTKVNVSASFWASRAVVARMLGKDAEARESLQRALKLEKNNKLANFEEVELAIHESDLQAAVGLSRALVDKYPNEIGPKILLARSFALGGNIEAAIKTLESTEPKTQYVIDLISTLKESGEIDVIALEKTVSENPKDAVALGQLCNALRRSEPVKSLQFCRQAYELEPENVSHAIGYAAAQVQLREFYKAIDLLSRIKTRYPENYTVRANLAISYFQLSQFENAKAEYIWITRKRPELPVGFYFLAITHDRLKEYRDAMANYQQFMKIAGEEFQIEQERVMLRLPKLSKLLQDSGDN